MQINSLLVFFLIFIFFAAIVQIHIIEIAFVKLGLTPEEAATIVLGTLLGSVINLPIYSVAAKENHHLVISESQKLLWETFQPTRKGKVVIAINVGGCLIPVSLCIYFIFLQELEPIKIIINTLAISALCYKSSRLIPGFGVGMPVFLAPLTAALLALLIDPEHAASLAYISGVLGVLIGADIFRLNEIASLGAPVASIGGAGTFDGIFITGIIAALLA
jgi:uncharacterized membrane protein